MARYQTDSESWSGNGAYLGLVLTVAKGMPLPVDLLEAILRMPAEDREQVFGDQFDLIVQSVALTPLPQHDFIEQWIWNTDRSFADRRDMVNSYASLCDNGLLDRQTAINALVAGLRRALLEEPELIAPYAGNLAYFTPKAHSQFLDEAFQQEDVDWFVPFEDLRRMVQDAKFAEAKFSERSRYYRNVREVISDGVMFDPDVMQEKPRPTPTLPALVYRPEPRPEPAVFSATTIRNSLLHRFPSHPRSDRKRLPLRLPASMHSTRSFKTSARPCWALPLAALAVTTTSLIPSRCGIITRYCPCSALAQSIRRTRRRSVTLARKSGWWLMLNERSPANHVPRSMHRNTITLQMKS